MTAPRLVLPDEYHPQLNGVYPHASFKRRHALQVMDIGGGAVVMDIGGGAVVGLVLLALLLFALALGVGSAWIIWQLVRGWH